MFYIALVDLKLKRFWFRKREIKLLFPRLM